MTGGVVVVMVRSGGDVGLGYRGVAVGLGQATTPR